MARKDLSAEMLDAVIAVIEQYGRPRKNPGGNRPVAVLTDGKTVEKVTRRHFDQIKRISLPGAFRYVELLGPYGKTPSEKAKMAFYEVHTGYNGFEIGNLDIEINRIDRHTSDSRKIIRSLQAARKKRRKLALASPD